MKLPQRLPSPSEMRAFFSRHALLFGYTGFTLVVILATLLATFPHEEFARRAVAEATAGTPTRVDFRTLHFRPPLAWTARDLRIVPDTAADLALRIESVKASPAWTSLLLPGALPGIDLDAALWEGEASAFAASDGEDFALEVQAAGLDIAAATAGQLPGEARLGGRADLDLEAGGDLRGETLSGEVHVQATGIALRDLLVSGIRVPDLDLRDASLHGSFEDRTIRIAEFLAQGEGLLVRATGTIERQRVFDRSRLDLRVEIEITDAAPPALRGLRLLLPKRKPGETFYHLRGTIRRPQFS